MHSAYTKPATAAEPDTCTLNCPETKAGIHQNLSEVEGLTNELKRLLVISESTLEAEGIRENIETLERWAESYRRGLKAAGKISELGPGWLADLRGRLKMSADELVRLSDEGGTPMTKEQIRTNEELLRATRRIDELLPNMEQLVQVAAAPVSSTPNEQTPTPPQEVPIPADPTPDHEPTKDIIEPAR